MFTTKLEVDKHVENCTKKITSDAERNNRSYAFAKLYYNVKEYEKARHYITAFLSVKPKSSEGNHLFGLILEKLGRKHAAIEAFRTSLQLDPKQNNLILKVCDLLADSDADLELTDAEYFCNLGEKVDQRNPAVYALKEKLMLKKSENPEEVLKHLLDQLEIRPTDVNLRIRLLKHYINSGKISEAYKHIVSVEENYSSIFYNNLQWYETLSDILLRYQRDSLPNSLNWQYWFFLISSWDRVVSLCLDEKNENIKESTYYTNKLFLFDQFLKTASENVSSCTEKQLVREFIEHYQGQLFIYLVTITYKHANRNLLPYKDAILTTLPLLFAAYNAQPVDVQALWVAHISDSQRKLLQRWRQEASFRCSQAGNLILAIAKDRKSTILNKVSQYSAGNWKEQLYKKIFVTRDHQIKMNSSFFITSKLNLTATLPQRMDVMHNDEESLLLYPTSLHHYIWVALNNDLSAFKLLPFEGLQYSVKNLANCGAGTLNQLDIYAFVFCAAHCAKEHSNNIKQSAFLNSEEPSVLPVSITSQLGTTNQAKFLFAAYRCHTNDFGADQGELRITITKGIEVIRCVGRHGIDVKLLVKLANMFAERSSKTVKQSEIEFNDARAELYWKTAMPLLEKLKNNQFAINYPTNRMFSYSSGELSSLEINSYINKGRLFLGTILMKQKEYEKALKIFGKLKDPYASFNQALIYKQMADTQLDQNEDNFTSETKSQNVILLSRARDSFYLTLDRLRDPSVDQNHPLNATLGTEIENIERLLSKADPDCLNRNECDGMSDENGSIDSDNHYLSTYTSNYVSSLGTPKSLGKLNQSTPLRLSASSRKEARPSPERLDAQIRQLKASEDAVLSQVFQQNVRSVSKMVESHTILVDELRSFKDTIYSLSSTVENLAKSLDKRLNEISEVKKSVDEIKLSVDDLQHFRNETFRNVTDMVQKIDKEVSDLKKDIATKQTTAVNDDLYVLDDDYGNEYGLPNNLNFNFVPNMANRTQTALPPNFYPAPNLYSGLYGPLAPYGYPNLALPQGLPFGGDQQIPPDLRNLAASLPQTNIPYHQLPVGVPNPNSNLNVSLLTGQNLAQVNPCSTTAFKETPSLMSTTSGAPIVTPSVSLPAKSAPVNVVITSSDPLPINKEQTPQPVLSVTIPPQHIKGSQQKPHNYQIPLPVSNIFELVSTPSVLSKPPLIVSTQGLLTNVSPPVYSAIDSTNSSKHDKSLNHFGGFKFVSTPTFKPTQPEEKPVEVLFKKEENKTASPFANFSFGNLSTPTKPFSEISTPKTDDGKKDKEESEKDKSTDNPDDFVPITDFKPVVPLPDIVEVKTGEENAEVLFDCRAKLLRHDFEKKEWKERGLGNMKILKENNMVRLLMRREQVHKVCCNHQILKNMVFNFMPNHTNVLTWCAQDFSEDELKTETFAIRFKTEDQANEFLKVIKDVQASLDAKNDITDKKASETSKDKKSSTGFGDLFKPAAGSWECTNCYVRNGADKESCPACGSSKNGLKTKSETPQQKFSFGIPDSKSTSSFTFGNKSVTVTENSKTPDTNNSLWDKFKPQPGSWECKSCYSSNTSDAIYCICCEGPKDSSIPKKEPTLKGISLETTQKFNFGIPQTTTTGATSNENKFTSNAFKFGQKTDVPSFTFNFKPPENSATEKVNQDQNFKFGSDESHPFDFKPRSPRRVSTGAKTDEESDGSYLEEESDNIYFKPVISLPDKVDIKTGEEEEDVLYSHRAKLFRKANGEFKERGLGDVKILRNKNSQKLRVVMRREQVFKICLNHSLTSSIEYIPKDEKTWLFAAADFSEGEISRDLFCLRFKTPEIAKEFKQAVDDALKGDLKTLKKIEENEDGKDDVLFVSETTVTDEEEAEAKKLGLPPKFFAYRKLPMCECNQCKKDDVYYANNNQERKQQAVTNIFTSKDTSTPKSTTETLFQSPDVNQSNIFQTPPSSFSFTSAAGEKSETLKNILLKPSVLHSQSSIFNITTTSSSTSSSNLFSTPTSTSFSTSGNLFGSKFSFSNNSFLTPTTQKEDQKENTSQGNIFSSPGSIFNNSTTSQTSTASLFSTTSNIFSNSSTSNFSTTNTTPSFSNPGGSLFGNTPTTSSTSVFASASEKLGLTSSKLFSDPKASGTNFSFCQGNIFGQPKEGTTAANPIFGSSSGSIFGSAAATPKTDNLKEDDEVVLKCNSEVTFSSIAKASDNSFSAFKVSSGDAPAFSFPGAGAPVFGSKNNIQTNNSQEDESANTNEENYDPHFEPIVPLPDEIVVTTGEEEETAVFNERAKLFRYDNDLKEWKERGVGQLKILHHPTKNTYRFLLRRELIHKAVLNQLITHDLDIKPMPKSENAWFWAGLNYVENEAVVEKLAVRLKNADLANKFYNSVQSVLKSLETKPDESRSTLDSTKEEDDEGKDCDDYEDDENYDDEDDEDVDRIMCSKQAVLLESNNGQWVEVGTGEIQIYYDAEVFGSRILFTKDDGSVESHSIIGINTKMELEGNECIWRTVECAHSNFKWRDLKAIFETDEDALSFHLAYQESLGYAVDIIDDIPVEQDAEDSD